MRFRGGDGAWLWAIVLLGAALRLIPIWFGLPHLGARPDEDAAINRAVIMLGGDLNPHFFHWPSLTFYVFAALFAGASWLGEALSFGTPLTAAGRLLLARGFVALAGTLTIVVLFRMGRRIADTTTGLVAALFLAVAIVHVRDSHFAMTDVLMTLLVTVSLLLLLRAFAVARPGVVGDALGVGWFAAAGLTGGLATSTKYSAAAIVASMAAAQAMLLTRSGSARLALRVWMPSAAFLLAFAAGFLMATPYAALDPQTFQTDFRFNLTHLSGGHGVDLGPGWTYHLTRSLPYGVGVPTALAALAGLVPFARHYPRDAVLVFAFAGALYVSLGSGRTVFFRYVMPLVPIVCLLAAVAVRHAAPWVAVRARVAPRAAAAVLAGLIAVPSVVNSVWFDVLLARTDTRVLAARWLADRLRPDDSLHQAGGVYSRLELASLSFHEWDFDPRTKSFGHPAGKTPDWLVFQESPLLEYARVPWELRQLAQRHYSLVATFPATRGRARSAVYDHQDAFFMPFSGFRTVVRPGPTISIYRQNAVVDHSGTNIPQVTSAEGMLRR